MFVLREDNLDNTVVNEFIKISSTSSFIKNLKIIEYESEKEFNDMEEVEKLEMLQWASNALEINLGVDIEQWVENVHKENTIVE